MRTLDRNKPYGEVKGDVHGRCFEQGGAFFDAEGNEWGPEDSPVGVENAEAALRARIEKETRAKVEREMRTRIEAEVRAELEGKGRAGAGAAKADDQLGQQLADGDPTALETLGLNSKIEAALRGNGITSVEALVACTEDQLVALPSIGATTLARIKQALKAAGRKLAR